MAEKDTHEDVNKVDVKAEAFEKKRQELAVKSNMSDGPDYSKEYGIIGSGPAQTIVRNNEENNPNSESNRIKRAIERAARQAMKAMLDEFADMITDIGTKLDDFDASRKRQTKIRDARENNDIDALRLIFLQDYNMKPDDIARMSDEQIKEKADNLDREETLTQETLIIEIRGLVQDYKGKIGELGNNNDDLKDQYLSDLSKLEEKAKSVMGVDFERAFLKASEEDVENDNLYRLANDKPLGQSSENRFAETEKASVTNTIPVKVAPGPGFDF